MSSAFEQDFLETASPGRPVAKATRWLVRVVCLVVITVLLWPRFENPQTMAGGPGLSPWVALASLLATQTLRLVSGLGLAIGVLVLFRRRWFCRWICPMGLCAELAGRGGRLLRRRSVRLFPIGQWFALLTLAGAAVGYPLLLWLDPLALWAGWTTPASLGTAPGEKVPLGQAPPVEASVEMAGEAPLGWFATGVAVVLGLSLIWPGLWCGRICPLGAFQEILWQVRRGIIALVRRIRPAWPAPESSPTGESPQQGPGWPLARRAVLAGLIGVGWAIAAKKLRAKATRPLRPPGAAHELHFPGLCIRCGNCTRVCPSRIIVPDRAAHGVAGLLAPVVRFEKDYCREDCTRCTQACPSGALHPICLEEKPQTRIGLAKVDMGRCLLGENRDCFICRERCPYQAIQMAFSAIEYTLTPQINPAKCNGCGACQVSCPTWPRAIVIRPV